MEKNLKQSYISRVTENIDLYETVLKKIMITCKQCIKYNFSAPSNVIFHG